MIRLAFEEVASAIQAIQPARKGAPIAGVSTDSRTIRPGELFFALRGPNFDGAHFVADALRGGAAGAVVPLDRLEEIRRSITDAPLHSRLIAVDEPLEALSRLAAYHRQQLAAHVIAVVGSNGKTTTKAMANHLLSARLRGRASPKSFNNQIGVPLTLLSGMADDDYLVVEIGSNAPGEVSELTRLASPDIVVVTSIGEEHLEGFGDLHGVAIEECSAMRWLRPGGAAVVLLDSPELRAQAAGYSCKQITFGRDPAADLCVSDVRYERPWLRFRINGRFEYELPAPGAHNALNAAAAIGVARRLGLEHAELAVRLRDFRGQPMRSELLELGGLSVLHDAYNANPASALAAIDTLESIPATRRIAVLGEMLELGEHAPAMHARVARRLKASTIDLVLLVGRAADWMTPELTPGPRMLSTKTVDECGRRLAELAREGDLILLKASRGVGLERALEPLRVARGAAVG